MNFDGKIVQNGYCVEALYEKKILNLRLIYEAYELLNQEINKIKLLRKTVHAVFCLQEMLQKFFTL